MPPLPNAEWLGAQHGAEIPYAFNWPNGTHSDALPWSAADQALAEQVSSYWVNFATTGDPNGTGLPAWSAFDPKNEQALGITTGPKMIPVPNKPALDVIEAHNQSVSGAAPRPPARVADRVTSNSLRMPSS